MQKEQKEIQEKEGNNEIKIEIDTKPVDVVIEIPKELNDKISEKTPLLKEELEKDVKKMRLKVPDPLGRNIPDLEPQDLGIKEEEIIEKKDERPSVNHELERDLVKISLFFRPLLKIF